MFVGVTNLSYPPPTHILSGQVPADAGGKIPDKRSSRVNPKELVRTLVQIPVISCTQGPQTSQGIVEVPPPVQGYSGGENPRC